MSIISQDNLQNRAQVIPATLNHRFSTLPAIIWLLLTVFSAALLYSITRRVTFLADDYIFLGQLTFTHPSFVDNLSWFGRDWGIGAQFYRPLVRLGYYFQFLIFQDNPTGWHLVSVALHAANAGLIYLIGWLISKRIVVGGVAGLVFALQPIHSEPIAWISGQGDLLATFFALGSLLCWIRYRQHPKHALKWYIATSSLFIFGLLSKEAAIAIPLGLLSYDFVTGGLDFFWKHKKFSRVALQRLIISYIPVFLISLAYLILRIALFKGLGGYGGEAGQKLDFGLFISNYTNWISTPFQFSGTTGLVLVGLIIAFIALSIVQEWEQFRLQHGLPLDSEVAKPILPVEGKLENPNFPNFPQIQLAPKPIDVPVAPKLPPPPYHTLRSAGFGFLWIILFLLPVLFTLPAERFTYLPSAGFAIFIGAIIAPFTTYTQPKTRTFIELGFWLRVIAIIALLGSYGATSSARIQQWLDAGNTSRQILNLTKKVVPNVPNYTHIVSEGVLDSNSGALIFRNGYTDAIRLLYKNSTIDVEKVGKLPILQDRLKNSIFLEYKGENRLINHTEIVDAMLKRNEVLKQSKSFLSWNFVRGTSGSAVSGNWFDLNNTGSLVSQDTGLSVNASRGVLLQSPDFTLAAAQLGSLDITMKVASKGRAYQGEVTWLANSSTDIASKTAVFFDIIADGQFHTYHITPEIVRNFGYADQIARIRLSLPDGLEDVIIQKIEQFQLPFDYQVLQK
ncbi:hypothetical protein [Candidatus Chlorohelix sp.]|uniref:hypothetical protein n=1 Tax=Candidatus Chlorohelix sp. TaxID=3139201 RepID=UPI003050AC76